MSRRSVRTQRGATSPFASLRNVGPAARADLDLLGVVSMDQLAASDPDQLYALLQTKTARKHDPCVWDVFAAAIHQARTGESRDWWTFTPARKCRQAMGQLSFEQAVTGHAEMPPTSESSIESVG